MHIVMYVNSRFTRKYSIGQATEENESLKTISATEEQINKSES